MANLENSSAPSSPETSPEKSSAVQQTGSKVRRFLRRLFVATVVIASGMGYYGYKNRDHQSETAEIGAHFDDIPDGDIVGKELIYIDEETGEKVRATFFMDAHTLRLDMNGESFTSRESVRTFITKIRKSGNNIVADLALESTAEVSSQAVCAISKEAKNTPSADIMIAGDYQLTGPVCLIPGISAKGKHVTTLMRTPMNAGTPMQ